MAEVGKSTRTKVFRDNGFMRIELHIIMLCLNDFIPLKEAIKFPFMIESRHSDHHKFRMASQNSHKWGEFCFEEASQEI